MSVRPRDVDSTVGEPNALAAGDRLDIKWDIRCSMELLRRGRMDGCW